MVYWKLSWPVVFVHFSVKFCDSVCDRMTISVSRARYFAKKMYHNNLVLLSPELSRCYSLIGKFDPTRR